MNATASVVVSVLAASAAAVGVTLALQPETDTTPSPLIAQLEMSVRELSEQNAELQKQLESIATRPAQAASPSVERTELPSVTPAQVAAAVEAYLLKRGGTAAEATLAGGKKDFSLEEDFDGLVGTNYWENGEAWKRAFEAGKMDEVIAEFEALATANPNDIPSQMALANAYMAYLQMDQSKWQMSMKADKQFDKVLDIDENHWEARFTKAVSYTFYPDFLGKKKDAITHFETLMKQQESQPVQDHQAQTYLYLGNMLAERDPERAKEIWRKGLQRHPNNAELLGKTGQ